MHHHHPAHGFQPASARRMPKSQECQLSGFGACHLNSSTENDDHASSKLQQNPADPPHALNGGTRLAIRHFDYEDRYFAVCTADKSLFAYGMFDGRSGGYAARFFSEEVVSQLLDQAKVFQLQTQLVRRFLLRVFRESDDAYARLTSIEQAVQERQDLRDQFMRSPSPNTHTTPDAKSPTVSPNAQKRAKFSLSEFHHLLPEQAQKYELIEALLRDGSSCVVSILAHGKLYTATCGSARAVLCRIKPKGLDVVQLSPDHRLSNNDERLRVIETGALVTMPSGNNSSRSSKNQPAVKCEALSLLLDPTRMLGNLALKLYFTEYSGLEQCRQSPLSAEPEIGLHTLISSDPKKNFDAGFLLLFTSRLEEAVLSSGLLQTPVEIDDVRKVAESVNELLCYMVSEEMNQHATLDGVARAVVMRVSHALRQRRLSQDAAGAAVSGELNSVHGAGGDACISLLIRNLRHPLPLASMQADILHANDGLPSAAVKMSPHRRAPSARVSSGPASSVKQPTVFDNVVTQPDQQTMEHAVSMTDISDSVMEDVEEPSTPTAAQHADSLSMTTSDDEDRTPWSLFSSAEDVSMRYADNNNINGNNNNSRPVSATSDDTSPQQPPPVKRIVAYTCFDEYFGRLQNDLAEEPDLSTFIKA